MTVDGSRTAFPRLLVGPLLWVHRLCRICAPCLTIFKSAIALVRMADAIFLSLINVLSTLFLRRAINIALYTLILKTVIVFYFTREFHNALRYTIYKLQEENTIP